MLPMRCLRSIIEVARHKIAINSLATVIAKLASCSTPLKKKKKKKREPCPKVILRKVRSFTSRPRFRRSGSNPTLNYYLDKYSYQLMQLRYQ